MKTAIKKPQESSNNLYFFCFRHPALAVKMFPEKGRGVIVTEFITRGTLLEEAPIIPMASSELEYLKNTSLWPYPFEWPEQFNSMDAYKNRESQTESEAPQALVLGMLSLLNHSKAPNTDWERDYTGLRTRLFSIRDIQPQEELTYDYRCDLWFDPK